VDLAAIAEQWRSEGEVRSSPVMVRLDTPERRVLVFADGRMIVGGTDDVAAARSLRARLLGT
jgi:adenylyltransferase/sulfurtransferase